MNRVSQTVKDAFCLTLNGRDRAKADRLIERARQKYVDAMMYLYDNQIIEAEYR